MEAVLGAYRCPLVGADTAASQQCPRQKKVRKMNIRLGVIGALLLTGFLSAGVCPPAWAQGAPPGASAAAPGAAVPWNSLSQDQQKLLSRMSGQWDQLPPQRQQALANGSQRWLGMSTEQRSAARQRFNQWQQLPQQRRQMLRQRWEEFRAMPPARQQAARENFRKFQQLPQRQRQQLRQRWQNATPGAAPEHGPARPRATRAETALML